MRRIVRAIVLVMLAGAISAGAQTFPVKPIRLVTNTVGGGNDFIARLIAPGLALNLGQPVIVENRPGGLIPGSIVFKAPADGYTLLVAGGTFWIAPLLEEHVPYDVTSDFVPIALLAASPTLLVVHPSLPVRTVKDLIALAKARPGELNYASSPTGSAQHLAAELFKSMARVNIVRVPYRGNGPALIDVIAGQVQMTFAPASAAGHIRSGKVRAIAITSAKRSPLFPDLVTMAESGLPGYEATAMQGIFAPARTPPSVVERINHGSREVLRQPEVKERLTGAGIEAVGSSPAEFAALIKSEVARMGKVIKSAGIHADR